jgi:hypothetical protein
MRHCALALSVAFLAGCAGKVDYVRPSLAVIQGSNVKVIDRPREAVWTASIPEIGKQYFVINNIDKASGLINVSYSGDPERFIDCGLITSYVKNARGERTYTFRGEKAQQNYEIMNEQGLFFLDRRMALEGRINLVFEEVSPSSTRVTANTRYVVNRTHHVRSAANNATNSRTDTINFNSAGRASFPPNARGEATECAATGQLEKELLELIK